ncbi:MAG: FKBP-type peptidyl-prolyl cis-trans isomerase [Bacteroidaceae bacterium]|nr:FKBP-type peptidyl-prolyl cis-trans isomerase [Bacteroidaceae bacterium]
MEKVINKKIRVAYTLVSHRNGESEEVEKTSREQPFEFLSGVGYTLDAFEENLKDLKKGDTFDFTIPSDDAYGEYDPDHVQDFDREVFTIDGKFDSAHIYAGNVVEMMRADGSPILGTVKEVTPIKVVMDFNHPLAGCDLQFFGTVVDSRPASEAEMKKFYDSLRAAQSGCGGCSGCGGGSCGDGCDDGCCGGCY